MNRNLVLVYPPKISSGFTGDVSLALLYLAGAARDSGVCDNISIFDYNAPVGRGKTTEDLLDRLGSMPGQTIVGVNCLYTALFPSVREMARRIKEAFPDVKIMTGGMHPTLFPREIIDNGPEIDAVGIGESDLDFPKMLRYFYGEGGIEDVEGYCLRVDGETVLKPKTRFIQNLDALPRPGYEFYDFREYAVDTSNWWSPDGFAISPYHLPLLSSRSCPGQCNFCAIHLVMGDRFRPRSAKSLFEEIRHVHDVYGVNYFKVEDSNFTLHRERTIEICKMIIDSDLKVYFHAQGGLSLKTLDEEVVDLMRRAGFIIVGLAVESGSDYIRNTIMRKGTSREQIINAFALCRATGMEVNAFFIVGMPEDTEETLQETRMLIEEIDATRVSINIAKPVPGTRLFEQCVADNLLIGGFDADRLWTGEAESKKESPAIKILLNGSDRQFWIKPYHLSLERLKEIDAELLHIAYEKSKAWVEHVRKNHR